MSNVPILQAVRAAFEFRRLHWRPVAGALSVVSIGFAIETVGNLGAPVFFSRLGQLIYIVASTMAYGALMRIAFAEEHAADPEFDIGRGGVQWRRPEWRLIAVGALIAAVLFLGFSFFVFFSFLLMVVTGAAAALKPGATPQDLIAALGPTGANGLGLLGLLFAAGAVVIYVRTSLAPAASIARKRVSVFDTWVLTKGQFWRVFAALMLSLIPAFAVTLLVSFGIAIFGGAPTAGGAIQTPWPLALVAGVLTGGVIGFVQLPVSVGLAAYLFRGLRPPSEAPGG